MALLLKKNKAMDQKMNAVVLKNNGVVFERVPRPTKAGAGHLLIEMKACAINPGDKAFITRPLPPGSVLSLYNIYGVSGAGTVIETGDGVPEAYKGQQVAMYRSLKASEQMVGTWSEFAHVHYLDCIILPDGADPMDYSGSVVNIITPYAFLQQISMAGHKGIISTAGTSATGIAMAGICLAYDFPLVSIVRNDAGKRELERLEAKNVVSQNDVDFKRQLGELAGKLAATAVFDGVGGEVLNQIIEVIPNNSTIYSYGYLGDVVPLTVHTRTLSAKGITLTPFANFRTATVQQEPNLEKALKDLGAISHMSHFKTKRGASFGLEAIHEALAYASGNGAKAILRPMA
jgi:NADPH2:quinone reductase